VGGASARTPNVPKMGSEEGGEVTPSERGADQPKSMSLSSQFGPGGGVWGGFVRLPNVWTMGSEKGGRATPSGGEANSIKSRSQRSRSRGGRG